MPVLNGNQSSTDWHFTKQFSGLAQTEDSKTRSESLAGEERPQASVCITQWQPQTQTHSPQNENVFFKEQLKRLMRKRNPKEFIKGHVCSQIAGPTAQFHSVTSDTPLKHVSGEKATYVKNLCHTAKEKKHCHWNYIFLVLEQYYLVAKHCVSCTGKK